MLEVLSYCGNLVWCLTVLARCTSAKSATGVLDSVASSANRVGLRQITSVSLARRCRLGLSCVLSGVAGHVSLVTSCLEKIRWSKRRARVISESSLATKSGTVLSRPCSCSFSHTGCRQSRRSHSLCPSMLTNRTSSVPCIAASACSHTKLARKRTTCGSAVSAPRLSTAAKCSAECWPSGLNASQHRCFVHGLLPSSKSCATPTSTRSHALRAAA